MTGKSLISAMMLFSCLSASAIVRAGECYAFLEGDTLRIGNSRIERKALWNNGHIITLSVTDKSSGKTIVSAGKNPDFNVNREKPSGGKLTVRQLPGDGIRPSRMVATASYRLGNLEVERDYQIGRAHV